MLRHGFPRKPDRSCVRGSRAFRRLPHGVLYGLGAGVVVRVAREWGDSRISARLALAIPPAVLCVLPEPQPVPARSFSLRALQRGVEEVRAVDPAHGLARSPGRATTDASLSFQ